MATAERGDESEPEFDEQEWSQFCSNRRDSMRPLPDETDRKMEIQTEFEQNLPEPNPQGARPRTEDSAPYTGLDPTSESYRSNLPSRTSYHTDTDRRQNDLSRDRDRDSDTRAEMDQVRRFMRDQHYEMQELKFQLTQAIQSHAQTPPAAPAPAAVDKVFLESLTPMEYNGEGDFDDYLAQFEGTSYFLHWTDEKRAAALYGRLKGRALTCVSSCPDKRYGTMVKRLKERFSPMDEEMYYQRLTTYRKQPDQSWEDLAQEIEVLALKAYRGMEEKFRESMAAKALVESVLEPDIRRKLRQRHPKTLNEAVRYARIVEADKLKEEQWQEYKKKDKGNSGDKKVEKSRVVDEEQNVNATQTQTEPRKGGSYKSKQWIDRKKSKKPPKSFTCYYCKMPGHIQRNCPFKLMMGTGTTFMQTTGMPQQQLPTLPSIPSTASKQASPAPSQGNAQGQSQTQAALAKLPSNPQ